MRSRISSCLIPESAPSAALNCNRSASCSPNRGVPMSEIIPATTWPNVEGMDDLMEIALNLHSCWNHEADEMWRSLDPELWEWTQNPWVILLTLSRDKIIALLASPGFRALVQDCLHNKRKSFNEEAWFQQKYPKPESGAESGNALSLVAYFSMEFMLTE